MIEKKDYKPAIVNFVGFLILLAIAFFVPMLVFIKILVGVCAGALLYASIHWFRFPTVILHSDPSLWQITDIPDHDDKFK